MPKPETTNNKKTKLSIYEQEQINILKKISDYKLATEANIVSILYLNHDLFHECDLKLEDFGINLWRVYWVIAYDIIVKEKKSVLDEVVVGLYLEKHEKLRSKYDDYGGWETILNATAYVKKENFYSYVSELRKWNAVVKLAKSGFPIGDKISEYADMSAEEIFQQLETILNHTFINVDNEVKSYNACDGLHELIERLNQGMSVGMPLSNCKILNKEIGGLNFNGNIYGLGAATGVGKSTMAINYIVPSIIKYDEKVVFVINEEDSTKVKRELLVWCANNVFKEELHKYILRDGKFDEETLVLLKKCADWLEEKKESKHITIIPLERYSAKIVVKIIKKYNSLGGVRCFVLDTLKESCDANTDDIHKSMMRDMVDLYDVIKPSAKNVCLFVTYQLNKASLKQRYYTNHEVGQAKSITDVMSVNMMMRPPLLDEYKGGKNELTCYKLEGKNGRSRIPFTLDRDKHYMIMFLTKNRFGSTNEYQIVSECDLSRNIHRDVGICYINQDW